MSSVPACATSYTERQFGDIASDWGYDGRIDAAYGADTPPGQRIVAEGRMLMITTACGLRLCASDLLTTRGHVRSASLNPSLTIYAILEGSPLSWRHGAASRPQRGAAHAAVLAVRDRADTTEIRPAGQRSRYLAVQVTPDTLGDAVLAEQVQASLRRTQARPLPAPGRWRALAADMLTFPPASAMSPLIPGLFLESCALEMLARGLQSLDGDANDTRLHPRDRQRMLRVRDRLLAEPGHPHRLIDLARDAGVSISTLKQKFPLAVGAPVFEYLRQQRLEQARRGLLHEGWSVKQAAFYAGYRYPANFTTAYRRKFGAAPSRG